jgi:hypothetical protein
MDAAIAAFCAQQREWLEAELQCDQTAEEEGRAQHVLHDLIADEISVGLYGRTVVTLTSSSLLVSVLPAHRFTTGDEAEIRSKSEKKNSSGVVCLVTDTSISIALTEQDDVQIGAHPPLSLLAKSSLEVHRKLLLALKELETKGVNHPIAGKLVCALFEANTLHTATTTNPVARSLKPLSSQVLDESQTEAVSFCFTDNRPVSLIHGPP